MANGLKSLGLDGEDAGGLRRLCLNCCRSLCALEKKISNHHKSLIRNFFFGPPEDHPRPGGRF